LEAQKYLELAQAYKTYQFLKAKSQIMDFGDLIFYTIELFKKRPNVLKRYQQKFKFVMVDEFQDTNIAQYELIKLLCPSQNNPKLTVVGDDSQSIYKFRGASVSNILNFIKDYPQAKLITLLKNYRSCQSILDAAYRLIQHNNPDTLEAKMGINKRLIAQKKDQQNALNFIFTNSPEEEADFVAKEILKLKNKYQYQQIAVLSRANDHADIFIRTFNRYGIPYQFLGPGMLYKQPEIKDLIAYLKILYNLEDSVSLFRVLNMDIFNIENRDLNLLVSMAKNTSLSLFETLEIYLSFFYPQIYLEEFEIYKKYLPLLKKETKETLFKIYSMIKRHLELAKKNSAGQILFYFLEDTGYLSKLVNYKTEKEEKIALNISKFFNKLKTYEMENEDSSINAVVEYLEMSLQLGESPLTSTYDYGQINAVNILTVHSAKGLEFPVVFLVNLTSGRFPTYKRREVIPIPDALVKEILPQGDYHLQEERRLFYVGLTRAMDKVYLTASKFYGEGKREQKISPFVFESLTEEYVKKCLSKNEVEKKQLKLFDFFSKKEEATTKQILDWGTLSYSQIETFQLCPLQYKYQYILRIPSLPQASASFGESIHNTLYNFYREFLKNKNIGKEQLISIFKRQWIPIGYNSKLHQLKMQKEGEKILSDFYENFHHKDLEIIGLEKKFKVKINNKISIVGKIDRIDKIEKNKIEIIDYKTGKIPDEKELKQNLQLPIYALAVKNIFTNQRLNNIILTFYFLSENKKISKKISNKEVINLKKKIIKTVDEIKKSSFFPKVGPWCDFCPFQMICEAWQ
ncbi:MAG: ATP-dependent helicase, partial [Microgenomates group bacterium]